MQLECDGEKGKLAASERARAAVQLECDGEKVFEAKDIRVGLFLNEATAGA